MSIEARFLAIFSFGLIAFYLSLFANELNVNHRLNFAYVLACCWSRDGKSKIFNIKNIFIFILYWNIVT